MTAAERLNSSMTVDRNEYHLFKILKRNLLDKFAFVLTCSSVCGLIISVAWITTVLITLRFGMFLQH